MEKDAPALRKRIVDRTENMEQMEKENQAAMEKAVLESKAKKGGGGKA